MEYRRVRLNVLFLVFRYRKLPSFSFCPFGEPTQETEPTTPVPTCSLRASKTQSAFSLIQTSHLCAVLVAQRSQWQREKLRAAITGTGKSSMCISSQFKNCDNNLQQPQQMLHRKCNNEKPICSTIVICDKKALVPTMILDSVKFRLMFLLVISVLSLSWLAKGPAIIMLLRVNLECKGSDIRKQQNNRWAMLILNSWR
jgi:hypothetical protein